MAVGSDPLGGNLLDLLDAFENAQVQPFVPDRPVVALDIAVLLGLAGLDMEQGDALFSAHSMSVPLTYSGPLSTLIAFGARAIR